MKKILTLVLTLFLITTVVYSEEIVEEAKKPIGLSLGANYYSTYLWRGTKFFSDDGGFCPFIIYEIPDTGLKLSLSAEISEGYLFDGFHSKPKGYYLNSSGSWTKKKLKFNHSAFANHSLDFGLDYSYSIKDKITFGAGLWYWWYFNSPDAQELAKTRSEQYGIYSPVNTSFMTTTLSATLDLVPLLPPTISVTYDYYTAIKRGGDLYFTLGTGRDFELTKEVKLNTSISLGYYYQNTAETNRYYFDSSGSPIWKKTPIKKGISDITPSISLLYKKGNVALSSGFYWVIVPAKTWHKGSDVHRYYAKLGTTYTL